MHMVCKSMRKYAIDTGGLRESLKRKFRVAMNHSNAVRVWLYLQKFQCLYLQKFVEGEKKLIVPCISTCYTPKKQIIREEEKINGQILAYSCRCPFEIFSPKIPPILKLDARKVFKIFCRNTVHCLFIN